MSAIDRTLSKTEEKEIIAAAEKAVSDVARVREAIAKVIFGQEDVVERALITILSGGHGLLVGLPGLAKTKLVETLGTVLGLAEQRIQFTPDLMPSDILGTEILRTEPDGSRSFQFVKGPIFAQLLMADEINRASPRTQAALLQAMQEYHVTIAGQRYDLPRAVPRARDPEPAGTGRHLSAAGSPARPVPDADRRDLSEPAGGAADPVRDDGHHRISGPRKC